MLSNESGYIFTLQNKADEIIGAFNRIEIAIESIKMSGNYIVDESCNDHLRYWVTDNETGVCIGTLRKVPVSNIPMGFIL